MNAKALAIVALGLSVPLTGCGSSSSSSTSSSAATPPSSTSATAASSSSQSTPAASSSTVAQPGASLEVGQTANVHFAPLAANTKVSSTLKVAVESIQRGTIADFNGIQLNADEKSSIPDYVTVTITNLGPGHVKSADAAADIEGVDNTGATQQSVTFFGTFPKCNDTSSDAPIAQGHSMHTCLTFLVHGGITKVAYTGTEAYLGSPVTWAKK
jgi:hypothetical protein